MCRSQERAKCESERIQADLLRAGLVVNYAKSCFTPTKQLLWLGFQLDLERGQLTVPHKKLDLLKEQIAKAMEGRELPAMALASVIGKISMSLGLGPVTRLMTRGMYTVLNARASWFQQVLLTSDAREELAFSPLIAIIPSSRYRVTLRPSPLQKLAHQLCKCVTCCCQTKR